MEEQRYFYVPHQETYNTSDECEAKHGSFMLCADQSLLDEVDDLRSAVSFLTGYALGMAANCNQTERAKEDLKLWTQMVTNEK